MRYAHGMPTKSTDGARADVLPGLANWALQLAQGHCTVPALLEQASERIARLNTRWRAISHRVGDDALAAEASARQHEVSRGRPRGPLHGVLFTVKGNIPVAGLPWTEGSALFAGRRATHDAAVVARVRAAGALVVGSTTLSELAMYGVTNPFEPMGLNPWAVERTAGGSSTGAGVAAALGFAQVHLGTDSGGSVRNPACHCGVVGFMPGIGGLSLAGKANYTPSLTSVGLIASSADDVRTAWQALREAGYRPVGPPDAPVGPRRLLVPRVLVETMCDEATRALFAAACERLSRTGFDLIDADIPGWLEGERAAGIISLAESGAALATMDLSRASEGLRARAAAAGALAPGALEHARAAAAGLGDGLAAGLARAGASAVITPTWPFAAPPIEAVEVDIGGRRVPVDPHRNCFVRAANAVDACALTLPMGLYPDAGVPAGLHLMAPGGHEDRLLALAAAVETCLPPLPAAPPLRSAA